MPSTSGSKYSENQILSATDKHFPTMRELLIDASARIHVVTAGIPEFTDIVAEYDAAADAYDTAYTTISNNEAAQLGSTDAFRAFLATLTSTASKEVNSIIATWDNIITAVFSTRSSTYLTLLPHGRKTITSGSLDDQVKDLKDFGIRLKDLTDYPTIVALGVTVTTFATTADNLRKAQLAAKSSAENARLLQEPLRVEAAIALYGVIAQGMLYWRRTPELVDSLWDVNILRQPAQHIPDAPADTAWDGSTRTISTTALPEGATRFEVWRKVSGGMPELLITGARGELSITIPNTITWQSGDSYEIWLVAFNSKGSSTPGPVQNWTAP